MSRWDFKNEDEPSRHLRMTIGVRYWRTDTRIASRSMRTDWKVARINKHASAPSAPHTHVRTQRHMCPQTSFKEACIHAGTMHDRDQSRCNRSVRRPRTRPPGDRHQMLDVGWSRAEEPITGHQNPAISDLWHRKGSNGGSRTLSSGVCLDHAWRIRYEWKGWKSRKICWSNKRFQRENIYFCSEIDEFFLFNDCRGLMFNKFGWKFQKFVRVLCHE